MRRWLACLQLKHDNSEYFINQELVGERIDEAFDHWAHERRLKRGPHDGWVSITLISAIEI